MVVVTNHFGDLNFPGVSLKTGANMVAPAHWETLRRDPAVRHYLKVGRLSVADGKQPEAEPAKPAVEVTVAKQPQLPAMPEMAAPEVRAAPRPQVVDYSHMSARQLCDRVALMTERELDQLIGSGEQRKTVVRAVEARYAGLAVGD